MLHIGDVLQLNLNKAHTDSTAKFAYNSLFYEGSETTMNVKQLVIRELAENEDAHVYATDRGGLMRPDSPAATDMVEALNNALSRRATLIHGTFDPEHESPFPKAFSQYANEEASGDGFLALCDCAMNILIEKLNAKKSLSSQSGYLIFSHHREDRFDVMLVALVRNRTTISLDNELHPTQVDEVDLDKLHQAAKINITQFLNDSDSYVSLIGTKDKGDVSQYFSDTFGCSKATPSKKSTGDLVKAAKAFCEENGLSNTKEKVVDDVVNYMNQQRSEKKAASLPEIEQIFDQYIPPEQAETLTGTFGKYANSERYSVSHEFQPHRHTLTSLVRCKTKADNWSFDFAKRSFGPAGSNQEIEFDEENQSITIKRLPTKVLKQLKEILEEE
jgi:nucleoid-associated protein